MNRHRSQNQNVFKLTEKFKLICEIIFFIYFYYVHHNDFAQRVKKFFKIFR